MTRWSLGEKLFTTAVAALVLVATVYFGIYQLRVAHNEEEAHLFTIVSENIEKANDTTSQGRAARRLVDYAAGRLKAEYGVDLSDVLTAKEDASPSDVRKRLRKIMLKDAARGNEPTPSMITKEFSTPPPTDAPSQSRYYNVLKMYSRNELEVARHDLTLDISHPVSNKRYWAFYIFKIGPKSTDMEDEGKLALVLGRRSGCLWTEDEISRVTRARIAYAIPICGPPLGSAGRSVPSAGSFYSMCSEPKVMKSDVGHKWTLLISDPLADESCKS